MKSFRVTGKITCFACIPTREMLIDDSKIEAADEARAKEAGAPFNRVLCD